MILKNDFKRTAIDLAGYELYQELNNPKILLLVKLTTVSNVTIETYASFRVETTTELETIWADRANKTFFNLIDLFSENI